MSSSSTGKRTKIAAACNSCKRRKTRCDGQPLCSQCARIGIECVYDDPSQRARRVRFIQEDPRPEALQRHSSGNTEAQPLEAPTTIAIPVEQLRSIEERLNNLTVLIANIQQGQQPAAEQPTSRRYINEPRTSSQQTSGNNGHLAVQAAGRVRYVEPTFWALICDEVVELDDLLSRQNDYIIPSSSESMSRFQVNLEQQRDVQSTTSTVESSRASQRMDIEPGSSTVNSGMGDIFPSFAPVRSKISLFRQYIPSIISQLPSKDVCDFLLGVYFAGYHALIPLFPSAQFKTRYDILWSQVDRVQDLDSRDVAYLPLLVAVLFAGAAICPQKELDNLMPSSLSENIAASIYTLSTRVLRLASFPETPTIETLIAFLICQMTLSRDEEPLACCAWVGLTVRVAHVLGLHRDPGNFQFPPVLAETRRRVWWQILHIDNDIALASGTPLMVDLTLSDVAYISEMNENLAEQLATGQLVDDDLPHLVHSVIGNAQVSPGKQDPTSPQGIYLAGKIAVVRATHNILTIILRRGDSARDTTQQLLEVLADLEKDLNDRVRRLKKWLPRLTSEQSGEVSMLDAALGKQKSFLEWAQLLLPSLSGRCWSIAQHVFPADLTELHERATEECRKCLSRLVIICGTEEFGWFQWLWPVVHQPLHAIMVLLEHVNASSDRGQANISHSVVEAVFAFCPTTRGMVGTSCNYSAKHRLSANGQEAWVYITRRRRVVWISRGFDPDERWSREQAVMFSQEYLAKVTDSGNQNPGYTTMDVAEEGQSGQATNDPLSTGFSPLYSGSELDPSLWNFPFSGVDDLGIFE